MKNKTQKTYKVVAAVDFGIYKTGELIKKITTDNLEDSKQYEYEHNNYFGKVNFEEAEEAKPILRERNPITIEKLHEDIVAEILANCKIRTVDDSQVICYDPNGDDSRTYLTNFLKRDSNEVK